MLLLTYFLQVGVFITEAGCMPIMFPENGVPDKLFTTFGKVADHFQVLVFI